MRGRGAKGSVKNRIYQFWLIRIFLEKKNKRKQQKLLKRKQKEEAKKKWERELFYNQEPKTNWKLSKNPSMLQKKEGVVITLNPLGKKPDKVIEVIEKKVGIAPKEEVEQKLTQMVISSIKTVENVKKEVQKQPKEKKDLENKNTQLQYHLKQIENIQNQYHTIVKKNPTVSKLAIAIPNSNKKIKVETNMTELAQIESLCRQELKRVETTLSNLPIFQKEKNFIGKEEKKSIVQEQVKKDKPLNKQVEKNTSKKIEQEKVKIENKQMKIEIPKMPPKEALLNPLPFQKENKKKTNIAVKAKTGASVLALTGGTIIAFPALLQLGMVPKKKVSTSNQEVTEKKEILLENHHENKNDQGQNNIDLKDFLKKPLEEQESKENIRLKLYKSKLQASKEAEMMIQSEINKQRDYLKFLNEKVSSLDITIKKKYHFQGIHHLLSNVLKFSLGVLTIPFSKKKIFGTVVGITLINNSIRGLKNSFKKEEEQVSYVQFKDLSKMIYSEKMALLKTKELIVDSLSQLSDLKNELESQFYGKVSFDEYEEMKSKLNAIEQTLLNKQKEVLKAQDSLEKVEAKNKVKVKRLQELKK